MIALTQEIPWIRNIVFSELGLKLAGPRETDRTGIGKLMRCVVPCWARVGREGRAKTDLVSASESPTRPCGRDMRLAMATGKICW